MDIKKTLNALIAVLLPTINKALPKYIVSEKLDPWAVVDKDTVTIGQVDLGLCTAKVIAKYSIKNMVGLSSTVITAMTLDTFDSTKLPIVTGTINVSATTSKNLAATLTGSITAACGVLSLPSVGISGRATAEGVTGQGRASFSANLAVPESCLTEVKLGSLKLDYRDIQVSIGGLGDFSEFVDVLVEAVDALFGNAIKNEIAGALQPVLNDLIKSELPLCISSNDN